MKNELATLAVPVITEDDVLKGSITIKVQSRDGTRLTITVNAMNWRTALGATFKSMDQAMIHILENCVPKDDQKLLDEIIPLHLVWISNVAQQLTNGVDSLKKSQRTATTPMTDPPLPVSMQPSAS